MFLQLISLKHWCFPGFFWWITILVIFSTYHWKLIKCDKNSVKNLSTRHTYSTYANELSSLRIFCTAQTSCAKSALLRSPTRYIVWGRTICPTHYGTKLFLKSNFNFEKTFEMTRDNLYNSFRLKWFVKFWIRLLRFFDHSLAGTHYSIKVYTYCILDLFICKWTRLNLKVVGRVYGAIS